MEKQKSKKINDYFKVKSEPLIVVKDESIEEINNDVNNEINETMANIKPDLNRSFLCILSTRKVIKKEKSYNCEKCNQVFDTEMLRSKHKCKFECEVCHKIFNSSMKLQLHQLQLHADQLNIVVHKCHFCVAKYKTKNGLEKHTEKFHKFGTAVTFRCDFDGKEFSQKYKLTIHMRIHFKKIKCEICNKLIQFNGYKSHVAAKHENTPKRFECKICNKFFKTESYLNAHIKTHDMKIECKKCHKKFARSEQLAYHMKGHENLREFECKICSKKFNTEPILKLHMKYHDENLPKHPCERCDFAGYSKNGLKRHILAHESLDAKIMSWKNRVKCDKCGNFYKNEESLRKHKWANHPPAKIECDLCGRLCNTKSIARIHFHEYHKKKIVMFDQQRRQKN